MLVFLIASTLTISPPKPLNHNTPRSSAPHFETLEPEYPEQLLLDYLTAEIQEEPERAAVAPSARETAEDDQTAGR